MTEVKCTPLVSRQDCEEQGPGGRSQNTEYWALDDHMAPSWPPAHPNSHGSNAFGRYRVKGKRVSVMQEFSELTTCGLH